MGVHSSGDTPVVSISSFIDVISKFLLVDREKRAREKIEEVKSERVREKREEVKSERVREKREERVREERLSERRAKYKEVRSYPSLIRVSDMMCSSKLIHSTT